MDSIMQQALEIVKAQAATRSMTSDEITSMLSSLTKSIASMGAGEVPSDETHSSLSLDDAKKAIREKSVVCMECNKSFKVLTRRHLAQHGMTPEEYKEKWGYKKGQSLVAKGLARSRKKKMQDMKLWEKRVKIAKPEPMTPRRNPAQEEIQ